METAIPIAVGALLSSGLPTHCLVLAYDTVGKSPWRRLVFCKRLAEASNTGSDGGPPTARNTDSS